MEFHHLVAKIIISTKRAMSDTCTAISFLIKMVREPDNEYWSKLVYIMKCIRGTSNPPLILSSNRIRILKWWIDGSFPLHPNIRGHTGGVISMGRWFPIVGSTKQKLNMWSSTETRIVVVDYCMPEVLWNRYWLDAQVYDIFENIVYRYN